MKKFAAILLITVFAACTLIGPMRTGADLGDFSGGSDYGGSDWGSSDWGSSDWDSSDGGSFVFIPGGSSSDGSLLPLLIFVLAVVIFLLIAKKKKIGSFADTPAGAQRTDPASLTPISAYTQLDPAFSEQRLTEKLSNIYVQMQNCCTDKNIEPLRPYFTDALFQQFQRQITGLKQRGETNYVERIAVLGVELKGYCQRNGEDHIIAEIRTRITDYTLKDGDGTLVCGDRRAEKFMVYEYDLSRPTGTMTQEAGETTTRHCPNCGAPLSVNESAKCPYCDMVITFKEHDWVVSSIKGISQRTGN